MATIAAALPHLQHGANNNVDNGTYVLNQSTVWALAAATVLLMATCWLFGFFSGIFTYWVFFNRGWVCKLRSSVHPRGGSLRQAIGDSIDNGTEGKWAALADFLRIGGSSALEQAAKELAVPQETVRQRWVHWQAAHRGVLQYDDMHTRRRAA